MRDPRTDPQPGDRLRVRLVRVEVVDVFGTGPTGLVTMLLNDRRSYLSVSGWRDTMADAVVEYAEGSDV